MIQTVTGKIQKTEIKNTLAHEHVVFGKAGYIKDDDNCYNRETAYQNAAERIDMIRECGVNLLVDLTTMEWGRDALLLKRLSEETKIHIVCATGYFKDEGDMLANLKAISYCDDVETYLEKLFVREITKGIGNTGIKAGVIKAASSFQRIRPLEKSVFAAAAKAGKMCKVPVFTHCDRGTMGRQQAELFSELGMPPQKVVIGHMTSNRDLNEIRAIMEQGFVVGFDQFGIVSIPGIPSDEEKMENLLSLLKDGYEDKIVLSHDTIFDRMGYISKSRPRYPDMIFKKVIPFLKENGIGDKAVQKLVRDNLLRVF